MEDSNNTEISVLFSQGHDEQLDIEDTFQFVSLRQLLLEKLGYTIREQPEPESLAAITSDNIRILVLGNPQGQFSPDELAAIKNFVKNGGGLLLLSNADTMLKQQQISHVNEVAEITGIQFQEYHNYPPTYLQMFTPHYISSNVKHVRIGRIAELIVPKSACTLAVTRATRSTVMACAVIGEGRVAVMGEDAWLLDDLLELESNAQLAANLFQWLAGQNVIDIDAMTIPEAVKWGETARISLQLSNPHADVKRRPQVECVLESYVGVDIAGTAKKYTSIPYGEPTFMIWDVRPQRLGEQRLRLALYVEKTPFFFDQLPEMRCEIPGYFTLETKNRAGELQTFFHTNETFIVEGAFHPPIEAEQIPYTIELQAERGLIKHELEPRNGLCRWEVQAVAAGEHTLCLRLAESGQTLLALVKVIASVKERLDEIQIACIAPLEAEIQGRLGQIDDMLVDKRIVDQPFEVLPPDRFVEKVYKKTVASWLNNVLESARREQWTNFDLLNIIFTHIAPTYLPNSGTYIPYAPELAEHLSALHHGQRRQLEFNLLCSEESDMSQIKQLIAAYLLHEKYGHGFFYTQTRLGQQLAILQRHGFPDEPDDERFADDEYKELATLIHDSALIANEGFAAWMELTFLNKLDRETRPAFASRRLFLLQEATGLYQKERKRPFFQAVLRRPLYDSVYREGFEYLEFLGEKLNLRCAVRLFLLATNIDLGIAEDREGHLTFQVEKGEVRKRLLEGDGHRWCSHLRLRRIVELLHEYEEEAERLIRNQHCPNSCRMSICPVEQFMQSKL